MKSIINFIKSVIEEVKKVEWINRKQLVKYTWGVVIFLIVSTLFVALLDYGFVTLRTTLLELV